MGLGEIVEEITEQLKQEGCIQDAGADAGTKVDADMVKALRCIASQYPTGDCHSDFYNFGREDGKRMVCYTGNLAEDEVLCPYHQDKYGVCFEDGDFCEWMGKLADVIEGLQGEEGRREGSE